MKSEPGIASSNMVIVRTWECSCGLVRAKLTGDPLLNFRCRCRSCEAAARHIATLAEKDGLTGGQKCPMLHPDGGGACASPFTAGQVEFLDGCLSSKDTDGSESSRLKFVRIGDKGQAWRSYTTCCGTQMTNCVFPKHIVFNRNGIKNEDSTPYQPTGTVLNIQKDNAFHPAFVPEPNHPTAPFSMTAKFMWGMMNPIGKPFEGYDELLPGVGNADIVPITWEEEKN